VPLIDGPACALWVERSGDGEPVSVFAHGVTGSTFDTEPLAARTPGTRVLFDLRGHGRSGTPDDGYGVAGLADDLAAVATWAGATRAFGLSAGAGAILRLLVAEPARFDRVVLMLPAAIDQPPDPGAYHALAEQLATHTPDEVAAIALDAPEYQALYAARPAWRAIVPERIRRMNGTGVPRAIRAHVEGEPPVPDVRALARVEVPVLLLAHRNDPVHPAAAAERLASVLPRAELRVWDEPLAMYDDVDALARLIGDFFAG
jgi:pimeloyl-ACP methyl ester carboxylesterase